MTSNPFDNPIPFRQTVYKNFKGKLRINVIESDLEKFISSHKIFSILDIGSGEAEVLSHILKKHPRINGYCLDSSRKMISLAKKRMAKNHIPNQRVKFIHNDFLRADLRDIKPDLIFCHAVINWVKDPYKFLKMLNNFSVDKRAYVSLIFGTTTGYAIDAFVSGDPVLALKIISKSSAMVPSASYPNKKLRVFNGQKIVDYLANDNDILSVSGIHCFTNMLPNKLGNKLNKTKKIFRDIERLELSFHDKEPFYHFANMLHVIYAPKKK